MQQRDQAAQAEGAVALNVTNDLFVGCGNGVVKRVNINDPADHSTYGEVSPKDYVYAVCTSLDNRYLYHGKKEIIVWDLQHPGEPQTLSEEGKHQQIFALCALPNGYLCSADVCVKIWDVRNKQVICYLKGHTASVISVILLQNGRLCSASNDFRIIIWQLDLESALPGGQRIMTLRGHTHRVECVCELPNNRLASVQHDGIVKIWNITNGKAIKSVRVSKNENPQRQHNNRQQDLQELTSVVMLSDTEIVIGSRNGINIYNIEKMIRRAYLSNEDRITSLLMLSDGRICSSGASGSVKVWSRDLALVTELYKHDDWTLSLCKAAPEHLQTPLPPSPPPAVAKAITDQTEQNPRLDEEVQRTLTAKQSELAQHLNTLDTLEAMISIKKEELARLDATIATKTQEVSKIAVVERKATAPSTVKREAHNVDDLVNDSANAVDVSKLLDYAYIERADHLPESPDAAKQVIRTIAAYNQARLNIKEFSDLLRVTLPHLTVSLHSRLSNIAFELLQNADDSKYELGEVPEVTFDFQREQFQMHTNEIGVRLSNAAAMCNVSMSDKTNRTDATGHKGIGFKSVFLLGDNVRVDSGHFHFQFDTSVTVGPDGEKKNDRRMIGQICPNWVGGVNDITKGTIITIAVRSGVGATWSSEFASRLERNMVGILLGARNLRKVTVKQNTSFSAVKSRSATHYGTLHLDKLKSRKHGNIEFVSFDVQDVTITSSADGNKPMVFKKFKATVQIDGEDANISIAIPTNMSQDTFRQLLPNGFAPYATLPIDAAASLRIHINCTWDVNSERTAILQTPRNDGIGKALLCLMEHVFVELKSPDWAFYLPSFKQFGDSQSFLPSLLLTWSQSEAYSTMIKSITGSDRLLIIHGNAKAFASDTVKFDWNAHFKGRKVFLLDSAIGDHVSIIEAQLMKTRTSTASVTAVHDGEDVDTSRTMRVISAFEYIQWRVALDVWNGNARGGNKAFCTETRLNNLLRWIRYESSGISKLSDETQTLLHNSYLWNFKPGGPLTTWKDRAPGMAKFAFTAELHVKTFVNSESFLFIPSNSPLHDLVAKMDVVEVTFDNFPSIFASLLPSTGLTATDVSFWMPLICGVYRTLALQHTTATFDEMANVLSQRPDWLHSINSIPRPRICGNDIPNVVIPSGLWECRHIEDEVAATLLGWRNCRINRQITVNIIPNSVEIDACCQILKHMYPTTKRNLAVRLRTISNELADSREVCAVRYDATKPWLTRDLIMSVFSGIVDPSLYSADILRVLNIPTKFDESFVIQMHQLMKRWRVTPPANWTIRNWAPIVIESNRENAIVNQENSAATPTIILRNEHGNGMKWYYGVDVYAISTDRLKPCISFAAIKRIVDTRQVLIVNPDDVNHLTALPDRWRIKTRIPLRTFLDALQIRASVHHNPVNHNTNSINWSNFTTLGRCIAVDLIDFENDMKAFQTIPLPCLGAAWHTVDTIVRTRSPFHQVLDMAQFRDPATCQLVNYICQDHFNCQALPNYQNNFRRDVNDWPDTNQPIYGNANGARRGGNRGGDYPRGINYDNNDNNDYDEDEDIDDDANVNVNRFMNANKESGILGEIKVHIYLTLFFDNYNPRRDWRSSTRTAGLRRLNEALDLIRNNPSFVNLFRSRDRGVEQVAVDNSLGYDFCVVDNQSHIGPSNSVLRIEVKSTVKHRSEGFLMSANEIAVAFDPQAVNTCYRVAFLSRQDVGATSLMDALIQLESYFSRNRVPRFDAREIRELFSLQFVDIRHANISDVHLVRPR